MLQRPRRKRVRHWNRILNLLLRHPRAQYLSVKGKPENADVFLNDEKIGTAPVEYHPVKPGSYKVKISQNSYETYEEEIVIEPGKDTSMKYKLTGLGEITVDVSPPGATVTINGEEIGTAPVKNHIVTEGKYKIRISMNGYSPFTEKITVGPGSPADVSYTLNAIDERKILRKSLVFPGSGQRYVGRRGKGALITILQVASIGGVVVTSLNASSALSDYNDAYDAAAAYDGFSVSQLNSLRRKRDDAYDKAVSANNLWFASLGAVAAVYLYNVIDAAFTKPEIDIKVSSSVLNVEPWIGRHSTGVVASVRF